MRRLYTHSGHTCGFGERPLTQSRHRGVLRLICALLNLRAVSDGVCKEDAIARQFFVGVLLLVSLSGPQFAVAQDLDECDIESAMAFEEWREWTATFPKPNFSTTHGNNWINIHIDDLARTSSLATTRQYEQCAKIAKLAFTDSSGTEVRKVLVMVKMPTGFDPDNGDWWYGNYDASIGTSVIEQGIVVNCIKCHKQASDIDYIFSKEIIENMME